MKANMFSQRNILVYQTGHILQIVGAAVLAVLYPLQSPFYTLGIMLFELGVFMSAIFLHVWISWIKKIIIVFVISGISLQVIGSFFVPEQFAGSFILSGIGLVCVGATGIAAKEAYYFGYLESWLPMLFTFPVLVIVNLLFKENKIFNSIGFSFLFILLLSLTGKHFKQLRLSQSSANETNNPSQNKD